MNANLGVGELAELKLLGLPKAKITAKSGGCPTAFSASVSISNRRTNGAGPWVFPTLPAAAAKTVLSLGVFR